MISRTCSALGMLSFINGSARHLKQARWVQGRLGASTRESWTWNWECMLGALSGVLRLNTLAQDPAPACVEKKK